MKFEATTAACPEIPGAFADGLSIVVPCGRPESARGTVESILAQDWFPKNHELILVGVAVGPLVALCEGRAKAFAVHLPQPRNPGATRAAGAEMARGAHLLFLDDDIELAPDFLRILATRTAVERGIGCIGARLPGRDTSYFSRVVDLANFWSQQPPESGPRDWLYSAALYVPGSVYHAVGGFRPDLAIGEDVDLTQRIGAASHRIIYVAELVAFHNHRRTSFVRAAGYFWGNGDLARLLYPPEAALGPFRVKLVLSNLRINLKATWRTNQSVPRIRWYLPGILVMYVLLCVSLEFHRQRYRLDFAVASDRCVPTGNSVSGYLLHRACADLRATRPRLAMSAYLAAGFAEAALPRQWRRNSGR